MTLKTLVFCVTMLVTHGLAAQQYLDLKMEVVEVHVASQVIYVDLSVRYDASGTVSLGDQNYRLFYDSKNLSFDKSEAVYLLNDGSYGAIKIHESLAHIEAHMAGDLPYDADLGFLNLSVDLLDDINGGVRFSKADGWVNVVRLKFEVSDIDKPCMADWSHETLTQPYATAFVEMTEWISPNKARPFVIDEVDNLNYALWLDDPGIHIGVGPNPAIDHLRVTFGSLATEQYHIRVTNVAGETVLQTRKEEGISNLELQVGQWAPAGYNLEIFDEHYHKIHNEPIIVTR